jgi:hypothetical protein
MKPRRPHRAALPAAVLACWLVGRDARATTFVIHNIDAAGVGLNDPTPFTPVGGNTATTLGAARQRAVQSVVSIWETQLQSAVLIQVDVQFTTTLFDCTVLAGSSQGSSHLNFPNAPHPNTLYPQALANSLAGSDLAPTISDLYLIINANLDGVCSGQRWYYGLDGNTTNYDFVSVLLHEFGHGLGFRTFMNVTTGAKLNGHDDVFLRYLERHGASPPDFPSMTDAQRAAAATSGASLHFTGPLLLAAASQVLTAGMSGGHVQMYAPSVVDTVSSVSHFASALTPDQVMEAFYRGPIHDPGLAKQVLLDIGWVAAPPSCTTGAKQCSGNVSQTCDYNGNWRNTTTCPYVCSGAGVCTGPSVPASSLPTNMLLAAMLSALGLTARRVLSRSADEGVR